jgi:hypothetical protein
MGDNETSARRGDPTEYPLSTHACSPAWRFVYGSAAGAVGRVVRGVL